MPALADISATEQITKKTILGIHLARSSLWEGENMSAFSWQLRSKYLSPQHPEPISSHPDCTPIPWGTSTKCHHPNLAVIAPHTPKCKTLTQQRFNSLNNVTDLWSRDSRSRMLSEENILTCSFFNTVLVRIFRTRNNPNI